MSQSPIVVGGTGGHGKIVIAALLARADPPETVRGDNRTRRRLAAVFSADWQTAVHPRAWVDLAARVGPGSFMAAGAMVFPSAVGRAHAIVNTNSSVDHDCTLKTDLECIAAIVRVQHRAPQTFDAAPALRANEPPVLPVNELRHMPKRVGDAQRTEDGLFTRDPVRLDHALIDRFLAGKRVMVTGAGGSIGGELARRVMNYAPASLLLVDRSEAALFTAELSLKSARPDVNVRALIADVGDEIRIRAIFGAERPQIVLHAAAHKHVPLMEDNAAEAVKNNVLATHCLSLAAAEYGVENFILISTDKAVRPSSVMGASKRVAELVIQDLGRRFPATRYVAVRFGNVIGSAGSVIPIFREQIDRGGPVTVTHPEATRYFMTLGEAAELVLEAGAVGNNGEILVLDMGEPVRILNLAEQMIRLSGFRPYQDIPIVFIGLRPGEKLHEDLDPGMTQSSGAHSKIFRGRPAARASHEIRDALIRLTALAREEDGDGIRRYLREWIPDSQIGTRDEGQGTETRA